MKVKFSAIILAVIMIFTLSACGAGEETTLSGMIVSVEGSVLSVAEMDLNDMEEMDFGGGEMPQMPEGMENFGNIEDFDPTQLQGNLPEGAQLPEGAEMPEWGEGEMPEMPEGMTLPEGMEFPEGMEMPENGEMPDFEGVIGGEAPDFESFGADVETKEIDISDAHISLEIEDGKASGSLDDIKSGSFVTITIDGKGKATYVLVSSASFFGGMNIPSE